MDNKLSKIVSPPEVSPYKVNEISAKVDFEKFKQSIKKDIPESLDYSLLEDEVMPELCDSPDVELQHRRLFQMGLSPLLKNLSFKDENWQEKISDESFIRTERLIRGDVFDSMNNENTSASESRKDISNDSLDSSGNGSLKFNDTLEEMEYFLKHGKSESFDVKSDDVKLEKCEDINMKENAKVSTPNIERNLGNMFKKSDKRLNIDMKSTPIKTHNLLKVDSVKNSPIALRSVKTMTPIQSKTVTPISKLTPFKVPNSKGTPRTDLSSKNTLKVTSCLPDKYEGVLSPIKHYIKNSPTIPMVKNVIPSKNYWDRSMPRRNVYEPSKLMRKVPGKENYNLPETAYKFPKTTNVVDKPTSKHLPVNSNKKIVTIANNVPRPVVIKHIKREKLSETDNKPLNNKVDDSYLHLPVNFSDVSHCVKKTATRTHTLK